MHVRFAGTQMTSGTDYAHEASSADAPKLGPRWNGRIGDVASVSGGIPVEPCSTTVRWSEPIVS
jgi:hypothetical protein